jgi:carboxylesterase type B
VPHAGFDTTFEANDDSAICPQFNDYTKEITGSLDCLHLNIYVPNTASSTNRLPVMVWIHEGGFSRGFAGRYIYGPSFIIRHDVILVTINYRLGPYGFMCLDTPDVPGNQGLKDQLIALRWIKSNIQAFGGDNEKITLFGQSAGSASNEYHFLYTNDDLFKNIILQSGAAYVLEADARTPIDIAEYLGFKTDNVNEAVTFLASVDSDLVIAATRDIDLRLGPCVEKVFENVERLITDYPINVEPRNAESTSIMIGVTNQEGISTFAIGESGYSSEVFYYVAKYFNFDEDYLDKMVENLRHFYIGDKDLNEDVKWDLIDFVTDFVFMHPALRQFRNFAAGVNAIYYYTFSYNGNRNLFKSRYGITEGGAAHTDELGYLFDVSFFEDIPTKEDQLIIDRITTLWTNFAKYGYVRNPAKKNIVIFFYDTALLFTSSPVVSFI